MIVREFREITLIVKWFSREFQKLFLVGGTLGTNPSVKKGGQCLFISYFDKGKESQFVLRFFTEEDAKDAFELMAIFIPSERLGNETLGYKLFQIPQTIFDDPISNALPSVQKEFNNQSQELSTSNELMESTNKKRKINPSENSELILPSISSILTQIKPLPSPENSYSESETQDSTSNQQTASTDSTFDHLFLKYKTDPTFQGLNNIYFSI